ncbi:MAG: transposase [Planctomycetes bacterium]|nr:transposase [Planctomycetota bacterium]
MAERRVYDRQGHSQFITFSCYGRRKLLNPDHAKRIVVGTLGSQVARHSGCCIGFCIMPNHVHALVWFPEQDTLHAFMDKWKELTSRQIASLYRRLFPKYWNTIPGDDPVWQARYYAFNTFSPRKTLQKLDYMHNNPVRAGFVKDPCDWPWSSARWYYQGRWVGLPITWPPGCPALAGPGSTRQ